jgi:hypothetical protein
MEIFLHFGHRIQDLYCPPIRSLIIESFLLQWFSQLFFAANSSFVPSDSIWLNIGLLMILFKSSCSPSSKKDKNSCASCWLYPVNWKFSQNHYLGSKFANHLLYIGRSTSRKITLIHFFEQFPKFTRQMSPY